MKEKRFVLSAQVAGKEIIRKAVWATDAREVTKVNIFSEEEFALLLTVTETDVVKIAIVETPFF